MYIWGGTEVIAAAIEVLWIGTYPDRMRAYLYAAAVLLTLAVVWRMQKANPSPRPAIRRKTLGKWAAFAAAAILAACLWLLFRSHAPDAITIAAARSLALAALYFILGIYVQRRLLYLGAWLLALSVLIFWAYLGFAPVVLGFFGGLSLIACGRMLRTGS
jgi:hypothetical protein